MSNETNVKRDKGDPTQGKTDYERLKNMTEAEVVENAKSDPDAPLLSEEELGKSKRVNPKKDK